ncbi:MAG: hypothetical protein FWG87_07805 [Defluviitaleaceae bacterium]|nr:hypothetical protein [Defluviitaleaceae bacterium]
MNETLRKLLAENKILVFIMAGCIAAGVLILLLGRFVPKQGEYVTERFYTEAGALSQTTPHADHAHGSEQEKFFYEQAMEHRLEEFFALVEGAGKVRVMVSPLGGRETVFAVDTNMSQSHTTEQDSQGGTRETRSHQSHEQTVIISNRQGADTPLVLREIQPRIEGIVIIAEGGDSPFVREALTRAARAVLGLDAHMIQVLTMQI